ncbi:MAG: hypothetical protein Q9162_005488 [Coniocarpon cinnabarinum]
MPLPSYGAPPLAKFFLIVRAFQLLAFIIIVGITANFVSEIVDSGYPVCREIVGTLTVTCLTAFYVLISIAFFYANANLGLLIMTVFDFLWLIAFIVIAVVLGKPLSYLQCKLIDSADKATNAANAFAFTESVSNNIGKQGNYVSWVGATKANCYESKAIWGISIGLCILFACSVMMLPVLWMKSKRAAKMGKPDFG